MAKIIRHKARIVWTGNRGEGTRRYQGYDRTWDFCTPGKPVIHCSNDPALGGDPSKHNPEDMLLAALSSCHMLWYFHLCSDAGVVVTAYEDHPEAEMVLNRDGSGQFTTVVLRPEITLAPGADRETAAALHDKAHKFCFIARSVNFPVSCAPVFRNENSG